MTQSPMSSEQLTGSKEQLAVSRALFSLLPANCYLFLILFSLFSVFAANSVFAQTGSSLIDTNKYFACFLIKTNEKVYDNDYVWTSDELNYARFALLIGEDDLIDTPLEFALLSYYSDPVRTIRPAAADTVLPENNPKLADQKLGAAVFQEMQVLRFLNDSAALTRHEAVLKFITDRGNVTRAEVEAYYRNGIRALISDVVDEEFGEITVPASTVTYVKQSLTNFYLTPNQNNFSTLKNIYQSTNGDLEYIQQTYDTNMINLTNAQALGMTNLIEIYQSNVRTAQNTLNTRRRQLNAPNDAPIDWGGFRSGYNRILNDLNPDLARKVQQ